VEEYRSRNFHSAGANLAQAICKQPRASCQRTVCSGQLSLLPSVGQEVSSSSRAMGWRPTVLIGTVICLCDALWVQLFAIVGNGWLHNVPWYYQLMPCSWWKQWVLRRWQKVWVEDASQMPDGNEWYVSGISTAQKLPEQWNSGCSKTAAVGLTVHSIATTAEITAVQKCYIHYLNYITGNIFCTLLKFNILIVQKIRRNNTLCRQLLFDSLKTIIFCVLYIAKNVTWIYLSYRAYFTGF